MINVSDSIRLQKLERLAILNKELRKLEWDIFKANQAILNHQDLSFEARHLLTKQYFVMEIYKNILKERIALFLRENFLIKKS